VHPLKHKQPPQNTPTSHHPHPKPQPHHLGYQVELVHIVLAGEEGLPAQQLRQDAADRPLGVGLGLGWGGALVGAGLLVVGAGGGCWWWVASAPDQVDD